MSDILDIESRFGSEFGEESDQFTNALKQGVRSKKGRGFTNFGHIFHGIQKVHDKLDFPNTEERCEGVRPQKSVQGFIIFVSGIHEEATEEDIKDLFSEYGNISNFALNLDRRTGFIKGYAILEYKTYEEASNTIENLNEADLLGKSIQVNWAFVKK